jgi:hypothetical protein
LVVSTILFIRLGKSGGRLGRTVDSPTAESQKDGRLTSP